MPLAGRTGEVCWPDAYHQCFGEQTELLAQHHELPADTTNGFAVVLAEVGDGLEVRCQASGQLHQIDAALRLTLQPATGLDAIEIAVDVYLQQDGRVVRRAACFGGNHSVKAQAAEIEFIDEATGLEAVVKIGPARVGRNGFRIEVENPPDNINGLTLEFEPPAGSNAPSLLQSLGEDTA